MADIFSPATDRLFNVTTQGQQAVPRTPPGKGVVGPAGREGPIAEQNTQTFENFSIARAFCYALVTGYFKDQVRQGHHIITIYRFSVSYNLIQSV
ncbi:hypothetical protein JW911_04970 [Candidatus Peregrinibacteria bacterium]|nr:hypothetical protein [Candidatus Peregrinibacteria bacterium]